MFPTTKGVREVVGATKIRLQFKAQKTSLATSQHTFILPGQVFSINLLRHTQNEFIGFPLLPLMHFSFLLVNLKGEDEVCIRGGQTEKVGRH